jgi:hypothetical protein
MFADNGDLIEDEMIAEFKYMVNEKSEWRWKPIRARYDKTGEYRRGIKNYGNAYQVANSNWHSIHNPVTEEAITSGAGIPNEVNDDELYYNGVQGISQTRGLRDFHNLFVKRSLLNGITKPGDSMIDFAVGKGGDIPKWVHGKLGFVYGLDIARDNVENSVDGCCARYLNYRKQYCEMPDCLFVNADSSKNIRDGSATTTAKGGMVTNAVFGVGRGDANVMGKGVYAQYGRAERGFDVGSIQFAIHYMCESRVTFHGFLRNVSECIKMGGLFVATCYDGNEIFNKLKSRKVDDGISLNRGGKKIWGIVRQYPETEFKSDESCLGYPIDVYQETINKVFREYLVNPDYLVEMMSHYGFDVTNKAESEEMGLPGGSARFGELYQKMELEHRGSRSNYGTAGNMSNEEKEISFLNRYYIFRKNRNVDAKSIEQIVENEVVAENEQITAPKKKVVRKPAVKKVATKKETTKSEVDLIV